MNKMKKAIAFLVILALAVGESHFPVRAAEIQYRMNVPVSVDGREIGEIAALDENYENNLYISLKGLAYALSGTKKAFAPTIEKKKITIDTEKEEFSRYAVWNQEALNTAAKASIGKHELYVDEVERKHYSIILTCGGSLDAFLPPISLAMMLDLNIRVLPDRIEIDTATPFSVTGEEMEESGYLQGVNALLIGDGSTGEVYYQYAADRAYPIASTTKLMTYLVFMDAVSQGQCSLEDRVLISERVSKLSNGPDGVIPMLAGIRVSVRELLYGMLLPSSNECALALAEHAAGSHEAFVERMNAKAQELGWVHTKFYNCHGLPSYEDQLIPAKIHNHMTAQEMFELAALIMDTYPQITEFTATQTYQMEAFDLEIKNSNPVLYNVEEAVGLKTGTTNKAGACLVTCAVSDQGDGRHHMISVLFGAEGDSNRGIVSEISIRYALTALRAGWTGIAREPEEEEPKQGVLEIPKDPEKVIKTLIYRQCPSGRNSKMNTTEE